jgi:hypothetical protein
MIGSPSRGKVPQNSVGSPFAVRFPPTGYGIISYTSLILGGYILGNPARGFYLDPCSIHLKNGSNPPVSIYPTILAVVSPLYIIPFKKV